MKARTMSRAFVASVQRKNTGSKMKKWPRSKKSAWKPGTVYSRYASGIEHKY